MKVSFKPRNHHALNPLMRKGGVHEKSNSAKRTAAKRQLRKESREFSRDDSPFYLPCNTFLFLWASF